MESKPQISKHTQTKRTPEEYSKIVKSAHFQQLLREKKRFIIPFTIFFFCFYFALPILTSYTTFLNKPFYGSITWAWVLAFLQFVMTWAFCMIYYKKASKFDKLSEQVLAEKEGKL
ncbi:DUF485 domain-containing protein [Paenibacillus pini]|uniref:DUF485 domain-containing protein n=1 Tax=Paenibacillus pini JCM 16418 TaxID=1236976 RepID=W7YBZ2_9BACL|nr:DUF485 domain-containing protein [Paenibacillus pini]GAF08385.1 hypothetical protein JCM16418_2459 [Paenibacillus pini JCM 16418]